MSCSNLSSLLATCLAVAATGSCNNRQAFTQPEPGFERMLEQARADPYGASAFFSDGRVMRMPVPGTISQERQYIGGSLLSRGRDESGYASTIPIPITRPFLDAGRAIFDSYCATCHGILGDGRSFVAYKMELRKPPSFYESRLLALPPGQVFQAVTMGYGLMPSYAAALSIDERWAAIAYLQALRTSQTARLAELPQSMQDRFAKELP